MAKNNSENPITLSEIRAIIPMAVLLVSVVLSWASLNANMALLSQRTDGIDNKIIEANEQISSLNNKQSIMNDQIVKLTAILDGAQRRGEISKKVTNDTLALAYFPNPEKIITFSSDASAKLEPSPTPKPTPMPIVLNIPKPTICPLSFCF